MGDGRNEDDADLNDASLIDVAGLSIDEMNDALQPTVLRKALDHILAASDNSAGYHAFNNSI